MFKIEYEIGLNEAGRPYIELPDDYEQNPEDKFFAIEIANYILQDVLSRRTLELDKHTVTVLDDSIKLLGQIGDEVSKLLYDGMKSLAEARFLLDSNYHIVVADINERDKLPETNILVNNKIYDRRVGLKVFVVDENIVYELEKGITNENWVKI